MTTQRLEILAGVTGLRKVNSEFTANGRTLRQSAASAEKAAKANRQYSTSFKGVTKEARLFRQALGGLGGIFAVSEIGRFLDEAIEIDNRIRLVTDSTEELNTVFKGLSQISKETRTPLDANVEAFRRLGVATKSLGISSDELLEVQKSINQTLIISGAGAQEARAGLIQLAQGLASNRLQGDELRSVLENIPRAAQVIADELGVGLGRMRELAAEGVITTDVIVRAFTNASDELDQEFTKFNRTISQSIVLLRNEILELVRNLNNLVPVADTLALSIKIVADNLLLIGASIPIILALVKAYKELNKAIIVSQGISTLFATQLDKIGLSMNLLRIQSNRASASILPLSRSQIIYNKAVANGAIRAKNFRTRLVNLGLATKDVAGAAKIGAKELSKFATVGTGLAVIGKTIGVIKTAFSTLAVPIAAVVVLFKTFAGIIDSVKQNIEEIGNVTVFTGIDGDQVKLAEALAFRIEKLSEGFKKLTSNNIVTRFLKDLKKGFQTLVFDLNVSELAAGLLSSIVLALGETIKSLVPFIDGFVDQITKKIFLALGKFQNARNQGGFIASLLGLDKDAEAVLTRRAAKIGNEVGAIVSELARSPSGDLLLAKINEELAKTAGTNEDLLKVATSVKLIFDEFNKDPGAVKLQERIDKIKKENAIQREVNAGRAANKDLAEVELEIQELQNGKLEIEDKLRLNLLETLKATLETQKDIGDETDATADSEKLKERIKDKRAELNILNDFLAGKTQDIELELIRLKLRGEDSKQVEELIALEAKLREVRGNVDEVEDNTDSIKDLNEEIKEIRLKTEALREAAASGEENVRIAEINLELAQLGRREAELTNKGVLVISNAQRKKELDLLNIKKQKLKVEQDSIAAQKEFDSGQDQRQQLDLTKKQIQEERTRIEVLDLYLSGQAESLELATLAIERSKARNEFEKDLVDLKEESLEKEREAERLRSTADTLDNLRKEADALKLVISGREKNIELAQLELEIQDEKSEKIKSALEDIKAQTEANAELNETLEFQRAVADEVFSGVKDALTDIITFSGDWKESLNDVAAAVTDLIVQYQILAPLAESLSSGSGGFFGFGGQNDQFLPDLFSFGGGGNNLNTFGGFGIGNDQIASAISGNLLGGLFKDGGFSDSPTSMVPITPSMFKGAKQYASGGVTGGIPAILHPNEAVVPLSGNRKIPVEMEGGGAMNVVNNFNFPSGSDANSFRRNQSQIAARTITAMQVANERNN